MHDEDVSPSRVCLVTGAAGKLGTAVCESILNSYQCVAVYRNRQPTFPSNLITPLQLGTPNSAAAYCIQADLSVPEERRRVVEVAMARFGRIDAVVNCAADTKFHGSLLELSFGDDAVMGQLAMNAVVPFGLISAIFQAAWKHDRHGNSQFNRNVVNISSISGLHALPDRGQAYFAASKAALNHLTRFLAQELQPYGVRANALCPSAIPDSVPMQRVISRVKGLLDGPMTGQVAELTGRSASTSNAATATNDG